MISNTDQHIYVILDINDTHTCYAPVVAWDNDGWPMVLDEYGLSTADRGSFPNFGGVVVLQALYGATHDDDLGRYRVTVNQGTKPFKSRFAALAEKHGGATPQVKWEEPDWPTA